MMLMLLIYGPFFVTRFPFCLSITELTWASTTNKSLSTGWAGIQETCQPGSQAFFLPCHTLVPISQNSPLRKPPVPLPLVYTDSRSVLMDVKTDKSHLFSDNHVKLLLVQMQAGGEVEKDERAFLFLLAPASNAGMCCPLLGLYRCQWKF